MPKLPSTCFRDSSGWQKIWWRGQPYKAQLYYIIYYVSKTIKNLTCRKSAILIHSAHLITSREQLRHSHLCILPFRWALAPTLICVATVIVFCLGTSTVFQCGNRHAFVRYNSVLFYPFEPPATRIQVLYRHHARPFCFDIFF